MAITLVITLGRFIDRLHGGIPRSPTVYQGVQCSRSDEGGGHCARLVWRMRRAGRFVQSVANTMDMIVFLPVPTTL